MIPRLVRTKDELKAARQILGLSAEGLVAMVRMGDGRTARRWESGESEIQGRLPSSWKRRWIFAAKGRDPAQLAMLESGEMRSGAKTMSWAAS